MDISNIIENQTPSKKGDTLLIRCMRKKFTCLLMILVLLITFSELLIKLLEKESVLELIYKLNVTKNTL